nr:vegetative cell wall protein gp1-like [Aegilops tauschii subsp. strangulata]
MSKIENKQKGENPYLDLPRPLAGLALCQPSQLAAPVVPLLAPEGQGAWSPHAARMRATAVACLPSPLFDLASPEAPSFPWPHSLSPAPLSSSLSLSPATPERTEKRRRTPTRPQPPSRLAVVPTRPAAVGYASSSRRTAPDALHRRNRRRLQPPAPEIASPLRRLQSLPRAAEHARRTSVSSPPFPLRPRARIRAVAVLADVPASASPPTMSPSWPEPPQLAPKHLTVLLVPRGCRRAPRVASPCPAARSRSKPYSSRRPELCPGELRPPRSLPSAPLDADEDGLCPGGLRVSSRRS